MTLDKDPVIENRRNSKISVLVKERKDATDPKFKTIIPALALIYCLNFLLAFFCAGAAPGCMSGLMLGGGCIVFGIMF
jgi:hypothetical protein